MTISPVSAAVAGALISGVAMYAVGPRADRVDAFAQPTAYVETVDGQIIPVTLAAQPAGVNSLGSGFVPVTQRTVVAQFTHDHRPPGTDVADDRDGDRRLDGRRRWRGRVGRRQERRADRRGARWRGGLDIRGLEALAR